MIPCRPAEFGASRGSLSWIGQPQVAWLLMGSARSGYVRKRTDAYGECPYRLPHYGEGANMKISTKARVAIAAILDIAVHGKNGPVSLADIGRRQRASKSYLEYLFKILRQHGIVAGLRGPGGGYLLQRRLSEITVADIIAMVDRETFDRAAPQHSGAAPDVPTKVTDDLWRRVDEQLRHYLCSLTLESALATAT